MNKVKIITCIYSDLYGTEYGGRPSRRNHYRLSLLSLLKMSDADFICYTSENEYNDLCDHFYDKNGISRDKLEIKIFNLSENYVKKLIDEFKDVEFIKSGDRCIEIQYMKFFWMTIEDMSYDYYYWFDAGLSHCGLIPNKHLLDGGAHHGVYYESHLFNNEMLKNLIEFSGDKFTIIAKENQRNYWSNTVNPSHFNVHDMSRHIIGGFFGGKKELWVKILFYFTKYVYQVTYTDNKLYHEEDIMTLMFRNHPEIFNYFEFDTWWHEDERISGIDMSEHLKINKSFYKILEELNKL